MVFKRSRVVHSLTQNSKLGLFRHFIGLRSSYAYQHSNENYWNHLLCFSVYMIARVCEFVGYLFFLLTSGKSIESCDLIKKLGVVS